ncbi:XRE family transcriptional regulator [Methylobacterium nonmethylotrophicum]|uniref:XRE family transcriptional regulator n=1 Tax=Methylobacterium nonmethylotrophicum TaxID=1141884 RepID=A0A4Z0NJ58_9HYPH|nr:XRE family transcriptional regulator [Methylobacterium nonmethylotrophicum]
MTRQKSSSVGHVSNRRAMRAERAAAYFDVSESTFLSWVKQGIMPEPTRINGCVLWCIRQLDAAFDRLCSNREAENEWNGVFQ